MSFNQIKVIPALFSPIKVRGTTFPNRLVLAPMMQYQAINGYASDWHLVHYGKFALGGFGTVMTEVVAVEERGRISYGDLGLWSDEHIPGLSRVVDFLHTQGALAAIQLGHAGRKGSTQRAWEGPGPLTEIEAQRGELPWKPVGPTNIPFDVGYPVPEALSIADIGRVILNYAGAAARADRAGFDVIEIHGAHGYLISSFLSPLTNKRTDIYGGDLQGRMRFALEVAKAMRANWPSHKPLFFRISAEDGGGDAGWGMKDSLVIAPLLEQIGVDIIDCSSGGIQGSSTLGNTMRGPGYQVPFADKIKNEAKVPSMAVGLILNGRQAEEIIQSGKADLIAIGRQGLYDPYWPLHVRQELGPDPDFTGYEEPSAWWLKRRAASLSQLGIKPAGDSDNNK